MDDCNRRLIYRSFLSLVHSGQRGAKVSSSPFLKWAGGKRWLVPHLRKLLPVVFNKYVEPFVGSGAVFFAIEPSRALLADSNEWLIETYRALRDKPELVRAALVRHQRAHSDEHYYRVRSSRPKSPYQRAANLIYLNRTCWNALFRVNKAGVFNVPKGTKNRVILPNDDFEFWHSALSKCEIKAQDFEQTINDSKEGDLIYADPPYVTTHILNGFIKYNERLFNWDDQIRLSKAAERAVRRGATVIVSNSAHRSIRDLYNSMEAEFHVLTRSSVIAASSSARSTTKELLVVLRPERTTNDGCKRVRRKI